MARRLFTLLALMGLLVGAAACSDDDADDAETTTTAAAADDGDGTTTTEATDDGTDAADAVVESSESTLGPILVDAGGFTLYVFDDDPSGESTCLEGCETGWPPLIADDVAVGGGLPADLFALIERPDGSQQLAADGRPLYRFAGDAAPGDTNGQGSADVWHVAGVDGQPVEG